MNLLRSCTLYAMIAFLLTGLLRAGELTILTEEYPPFNYEENKELKGASVDIVKELQKRVGNTDPIKVELWSKAYNICLTQKNIALFSTTRTEAREKLFQWVGPLVTDTWCLFAKKGSGITIKTLEDAKKYKVGAYLNDAIEQYLLKDAGFGDAVQSVKENQLNARKLMAGRIQLWAGGDVQLPYLMVKEGFKADDIEKLLEFRKTEMYLAFSKDTDPAIVAKWQAAYEAMKKDGTYDKIMAAYKK